MQAPGPSGLGARAPGRPKQAPGQMRPMAKAGVLTARGALERFFNASIPSSVLSAKKGALQHAKDLERYRAANSAAGFGSAATGGQNTLLAPPSAMPQMAVDFGEAAATGRKGDLSPEPGGSPSLQPLAAPPTEVKRSWFSRRPAGPVRGWDVERPGWEWGVEPKEERYEEDEDAVNEA